MKDMNHMADLNETSPKASRSLIRRYLNTSKRTFLIYPICIVGFEYARQGGDIHFIPWGAPLLLWGYLQYRLVGRYRGRRGGGGPGLEVPPERIVSAGPYRFLRNPMYLGHLIFMAGLALSMWSWLALALLAVNMGWFHRRVLDDEVHLLAMFGAEYGDYTARVKRWIPYVL